MFRFPDRFAKFISIEPALIKVDRQGRPIQGDCWCWKGRLVTGKNGATQECNRGGELGGRGYGQVKFRWPGTKRGSARQAHRVMYLLMTGVDPGEYVLDHLCERRSCVNPLHLEQVTVLINTLRGNAVLYKILNRYAEKEAAQNAILGGSTDFDGCSD